MALHEVRELDFHDCCSPAAHPGDNIVPLIAVAQQMGCDGAALVRAITVAYEIQVALVQSIPLAPPKKNKPPICVPPPPPAWERSWGCPCQRSLSGP